MRDRASSFDLSTQSNSPQKNNSSWHKRAIKFGAKRLMQGFSLSGGGTDSSLAHTHIHTGTQPEKKSMAKVLSIIGLMVWSHSGPLWNLCKHQQKRTIRQVAPVCTDVAHWFFWICYLFSDWRIAPRKQEEKSNKQQTETWMSRNRDYCSIILTTIIQSAAQAPKLLLQIFGLKFLNVSICFLDFFVLLNSNLSVTWWGVCQPWAGDAEHFSNLQLWTVLFIFSETIWWFFFFYTFFSFFCTARLRWTEICG